LAELQPVNAQLLLKETAMAWWMKEYSLHYEHWIPSLEKEQAAAAE
jgi:hypothetical protein